MLVSQHLFCLFIGADVLNQLAAMKQQLQNERQRVESMLNTDRVCIIIISCFVCFSSFLCEGRISFFI